MRFRSAIGLAAVVLIGSPALAQEPPEQMARLKVRLEVSKKLATLFVLTKDKVLLKNGVELTLLRGCDVELMVADRNLAFVVPP